MSINKELVIKNINLKYNLCFQNKDPHIEGYIIDIYDGFELTIDELSLCMSDETCQARHLTNRCIGAIKRMEGVK